MDAGGADGACAIVIGFGAVVELLACHRHDATSGVAEAELEPDCAPSPRSATIWSRGSRADFHLQIWDLKTYKLKVDLPGHTDEVYCVDFVADKLVSGGRDRTVKM